MGFLEAKKQYKPYASRGKSFDDGKLKKGDPIGYELRSGHILDALRFLYDNDETPMHGGKGGSLGKYLFDPDDYLVKIDLEYGKWEGADTVTKITFTTRKGIVKSHGQISGGQRLTYFFDNKPITAIAGQEVYIDKRNETYIADLGVYYVEIKK